MLYSLLQMAFHNILNFMAVKHKQNILGKCTQEFTFMKHLNFSHKWYIHCKCQWYRSKIILYQEFIFVIRFTHEIVNDLQIIISSLTNCWLEFMVERFKKLFKRIHPFVKGNKHNFVVPIDKNVVFRMNL